MSAMGFTGRHNEPVHSTGQIRTVVGCKFLFSFFLFYFSVVFSLQSFQQAQRGESDRMTGGSQCLSVMGGLCRLLIDPRRNPACPGLLEPPTPSLSSAKLCSSTREHFEQKPPLDILVKPAIGRPGTFLLGLSGVLSYNHIIDRVRVLPFQFPRRQI